MTCEKIVTFKEKSERITNKFDDFLPKHDLRAVQKNADFVDLEMCWKMSLLSLSEASIQPRTGPPKFDQPTYPIGPPLPSKKQPCCEVRGLAAIAANAEEVLEEVYRCLTLRMRAQTEIRRTRQLFVSISFKQCHVFFEISFFRFSAIIFSRTSFVDIVHTKLAIVRQRP